MMQKEYVIFPEDVAEFYNHTDECIGTGRMGLALHKEYFEQLKMVQEEIGFKHIRGHGLFCDDMAIYQEYIDEDGNAKDEYNFTYLDRVMDSYRELSLKPFIELGFMPYKLASGTQTLFYWQGNTTPPKDHDAWCELVKATLSHLMERYGANEVVTWPVEVWNEPNLAGFWENADKEAYFKLFACTFRAVKELDARFRVGGPAVCGGTDEEWIQAFMTFCHEQKIAVDFITRHHYTTEFPEYVGHYGYAKLSNPEDGFANLQTTRDIIDSFEEYRGLEIHITEFNTSYIPNCPLHDTNLNAAYIATQLSRLGDVNTSYSYWTFGDVFEERGVPYTPFHGGFGLVANGCIPKPTFWTFRFFKQLTGKCVQRSESLVVVKQPDGSYRGVLWNLCGMNAEELTVKLSLKDVSGDEYWMLKQTVDEEVCNPLKTWHDMGEPPILTNTETKLLQQAAQPLTETAILQSVEGEITFEDTLKPNAVVYFEIKCREAQSDRGYSYERAIAGHDF